MIHLGFSGTRYGMTQKQKEVFRAYLAIVNPKSFHEGCCVGSDFEAINLAFSHKLLSNPELKLIAHPPLDRRLAHEFSQYDEIRSPLRHFARNRAIVDETAMTVSTPYDSPETLEEIKGSLGGTWHCTNYSIKRGHHTHIILPSGEILDQFANKITLNDIKIIVANWL